jgi:hypothetical protein
MIRAKLALEGIAKARKNTDQNFQFRGIDDILDALAPLLVAHQLNVFPRAKVTQSQERKTSTGKTMNAVFIDMELDFVSLEDGSIYTARMPGEGSDMSDKGTAKANSGAYKYLMIMTFVIPTKGVLDEGDANSPGAEREQDRPARGGGRQQSDNRTQQRERPRDNDRGDNDRKAAGFKREFLDKLRDCRSAGEVDTLRRENAAGLEKLREGWKPMFRDVQDALDKAYTDLDDVPF